jgi:hydroxyacylglutathione hydrolase
MIKIEKFTCNMLQENCYVVNDETGECVIIDCGAYYEAEKQAIEEYIKQNQLRPVHLVATHGHLDHNFGDAFITSTYGLPLEIDASDEAYVRAAEKQASFFGVAISEPVATEIKTFHDGDKIKFGSHEIDIIGTPGHSMGSVVLYIQSEKVAFSGDTLFRGAIGRTDFEGGSMLMIIQSLRMLVQLPDDTRVLPGHGGETTMGYELAHNPYLDR